jgi:hypothetical protein
MFGFVKEVKLQKNLFIQSATSIDIHIPLITLFHTELNGERVYIKIASIVDSNDIYAALRLDKKQIRAQFYHVVSRICVIEKHRNKRLVNLLYKHAIELGFKLMSDSTQTTFGSKDIWLKFPNYFPEKELFVYNIESLRKRRLIEQKEHEIWGKEEDDYFDMLDEEEKIYMIEEQYSNSTISKEQREFFKTYLNVLSDRKDIRLTIE